MTLTEVVTHLRKGNLLDTSFPQSCEAVQRAAEYLLDYKDLMLAVELFLEKSDDLREQLLRDCLVNAKARVAA